MEKGILSDDAAYATSKQGAHDTPEANSPWGTLAPEQMLNQNGPPHKIPGSERLEPAVAPEEIMFLAGEGELHMKPSRSSASARNFSRSKDCH
jgi:hypothetical protein